MTLLLGNASCGIYGDRSGRVVAEIENATALTIANTNPYSVSLNTSVADTILACSGNQSVDISLTMLDPGPTNLLDSMEVRLPKGFTYVGNSTSQTPVINVVDGLSSILFGIEPQLIQNESFDFSIDFTIDKDSLECSENSITANSFTIEQIQCTTAPLGETCEVYSTTGYSESFFFVDKPDLTADFLFATASCSSANMDLAYEIEITNNSSEDIPTGEDFTVDVYYNLDGSCSIFGNSSLIKTLTINGPLLAGTSIVISDVVEGVQVDACNIIAKINGCTCESSPSNCEEIIIDNLPANKYGECYPNNLTIETCKRPEFTYTWVGIDDASISWFTSASNIYNPTLSLPDPGNTTKTYQFEV